MQQKIYCLLFLLAGGHLYSFGQQATPTLTQYPQHEVFLQLGFNKLEEEYRTIRFSSVPGLSLSDTAYYTQRNAPIVFLGYRFLLNKWVSGYISTCYQQYDTEDTYTTKVSRSSTKQIGIQIGIEAYWLRHKKWALYSNYGTGMLAGISTYTSFTGLSNKIGQFNLSMQLAPLGIRYGKKYGFYADYAFGGPGHVHLGGFYQL